MTIKLVRTLQLVVAATCIGLTVQTGAAHAQLGFEIPIPGIRAAEQRTVSSYVRALELMERDGGVVDRKWIEKVKSQDVDAIRKGVTTMREWNATYLAHITVHKAKCEIRDVSYDYTEDDGMVANIFCQPLNENARPVVWEYSFKENTIKKRPEMTPEEVRQMLKRVDELLRPYQ